MAVAEIYELARGEKQMSRFTEERSTSYSVGQDNARSRAGLEVVVLIVAALVLVSLLVACGSSPSEPTQAPAQDGATLLETRCSACHSVDRPKQVTKTAGEWEQTVDRMIGHGAQLNDAEKSALVEYLAQNYGP
jgi:mono/diheme cytochrome c family protein